ncbi:hypothetical protein BDN70DRAFT_895143 [Pholiota conissans]|uniref:Uncharacterized protein n=1 Tax=Pholiota conissans TaxID=109636 RepID=A0A9P6D0B4_9AGAR|nr:hypothetical protein BDN70DRAFT_895143 [Pholiota conissans]
MGGRMDGLDGWVDECDGVDEWNGVGWDRAISFASILEAGEGLGSWADASWDTCSLFPEAVDFLDGWEEIGWMDGGAGWVGLVWDRITESRTRRADGWTGRIWLGMNGRVVLEETHASWPGEARTGAEPGDLAWRQSKGRDDPFLACPPPRCSGAPSWLQARVRGPRLRVCDADAMGVKLYILTEILKLFDELEKQTARQSAEALRRW